MGDLLGVLHAVNAETGKALWTFKTEDQIKSSPVIVGDRVLIGSYDNNLYALSRRDGKLIWKAITQNYVHGTPAISGGLAYVAGCDEVFHGIRLRMGRKPCSSLPAVIPALLPRWSASVRITAISTTKWSARMCVESGLYGGIPARSRSIPRRQ